jgi:hypothetical protein
MLPSPPALTARRLRKTLSPLIDDAARESRADRYRKSFPASAHVWMLLLHAMGGNASLRQSHAQQQADPELRSRLGMPGWISFSQLARSSTSRPPECFERLLASVKRRARSRPGSERLPKLLGEVAVLDSTFFSLSRKLSPWSRHKRHAPGARLQAELDLSRSIPASLRMTTPEVNDRTALREWDLSGLEGWTLVFDLGYYAHAHFRRLLEGGVSFVTRLQSQASYETVSEDPASVGRRTQQGDTVVRDETIVLGSPNNRTGAVLENVRLVTSRTEKGEAHTLLTDRHDLSASEVVELYRKRWRIELFFRWLKRELGALRALGTSREAVWLKMLLAAMVALIASLCDAPRPRGVTRVAWLRALWCALFGQLRLSG